MAKCNITTGLFGLVQRWTIIVSCLTGNCTGIDPDITNRKLICCLKNENSFRSDTELPVVEPENIEIDGEIFVNDTDFDKLMQTEGTDLPLIELQDQNVNPTVDELTVTRNSDKKLNTNPLQNIRGSFTPYITNSVVNFTINMSS
jgi:hypothetical protein